ncbi:hypothetical protein BDV12DRAFT_204252 [Aspergillus spectabilis]
MYRPAGGTYWHRHTPIILYSLFLLLTTIPEAVLLACGQAQDQYGSKLLELVLFIPISMGNVLATILVPLSFAFQARQIVQQQQYRGGSSLSSETTTALSSSSLLTQAVVFALLAASWVWRVSWEHPPARITVKQWFSVYGWAIVQNVTFALVQFGLFCMTRYGSQGRVGSASSPMAQEVEVEPLLHGRF